jgi:hypothetical protein
MKAIGNESTFPDGTDGPDVTPQREDGRPAARRLNKIANRQYNKDSDLIITGLSFLVVF